MNDMTHMDCHSEHSEESFAKGGRSLAAFRMTACLMVCVTSLLLTACAKPVTRTPLATQAELEQERQIQKELLNQKDDDAPSVSDRAAIINKLSRVAAKVQPAAFTLCQEIGARACRFDIALDKDGGGLNAYADGTRVVVFPEMVAFTKNDEELGLVVAHELAHNIMRHPDNQKKNAGMAGLAGALADALAQSQGINTGGALSNLGAQGAVLHYSADFEREADYVGMYILARSDYAYADAAKFWRRMSKKNPDGIYVGTTHPTNPDRYVSINKIVAEIDRKKQAGIPLLPEIQKD
jgi:predicted Zn-dependent protease